MLASGDISGEIRVWKMSNGKCLRKLHTAHNGDGAPVHSILITEDKQSLYAYTSDLQTHSILTFGLSAGTCTNTIKCQKEIQEMSFFDKKQEFIMTIQSDVIEIIDPSQ